MTTEDAAPPDGPGPDEDGAGAERRKGRLHGEVASRLRRMIVTGELPPGERLREAPLCARLGVSRTPLREALRTLAAEGLVDPLPNRSVVVAPLQAPEIVELFQVFGAVEALAAELACDRIADAEITEIGDLLSRMIDAHAQGDRAGYLALNQAIHRRTLEISGNAVLLSVWRSLEPRVERARALPNLDRDRWTAALFEHSKMFAALAARDGPTLARLTRAHFLNALPYVAPQASAPPDNAAD